MDLGKPLLSQNHTGHSSQPLSVDMDTGSSEMWVNVPKSKFCRDMERICYITGTFDSKASSTKKLVDHEFKVRYADQSGASGDYVTDHLHLSGQELKNLLFGLGNVTSSRIGKFGIGYPIRKDKPFPTLPEILKNSGLIDNKAFSLWLNDRKASHGSLLFGGVDTPKSHGNLITLPIEKIDGRFEFFLINLTGLRFTHATGNIQFARSILPVPVVLDSGSTLTILPNGIVLEIFDLLKVVVYDNTIPTVDYGLGRENYTLDFTFTTARIRVPMSELVLPILPDQHGNRITKDDSTPLCRLGITYATNPASFRFWATPSSEVPMSYTT